MISLSFRYAVRDMRGAFASLRIVLLCLVLGVAAIAAVQVTSRSILSGIERDGRTILGGDVMVRNIYNPATPDLMAWFAKRGGVMTETIETRAMLANTQTRDNTLVELKAVAAGYPLYGTFETDAGNDIQALLADGGIVLDPALAQKLNVTKGDTISLGGKSFTVRALIVREPDRASTSQFGLAPRAMIASGDLAATGLTQPGGMLYYYLRARLPAGTALEATTKALKDEFKNVNWRITDADNASPRITSFLNRLMLFLTLVGLSALLIGGIGIGNGMRAHLETRLKTVAIFKTLGAPARFITRIYFWQVALIGTLGTLLGVAIGFGLPYLAMPLVVEMLPFSVTPEIGFGGVMVPVAFGLLTCLVFSLWPLGQAVATSPLELFRAAISPRRERPAKFFRKATWAVGVVLAGLAIGTARDTRFAMWFVIGAIFCLFVFWALGWLVSRGAGRVRAPSHPALRLALRNLHRPGNATANTLVSLGLGLTVLMTITLIELNLRQGINNNLPEDAPSFFFLDIQGNQKDAFEKMLREQPTASTIVFSPNLRGRIVSVNDMPAAQALKDESERWLLQNDRGFTYVSDLPAHSEITAGEWWPQDYKGPPLVSVVDDVERGFGVKPGDSITVNILGRDITATIANVREVTWTNFTVNFAITFAPGTLEGAPHSWLATVVADPGQENEIQRNLGAAFPNVSMIRVSEAIEAVGGILGNMATAVRATALVAVVTGILVLAGSLAATRTQRLYDTVVLKVLGIRGRTLLSGFLLEFGLLGLLAGVVSLGLGTLISWAVLRQLIELPWQFYPWPAVLTGAAGLLLTIGIGWVVTGRTLSSPAAPYLRNE